MPNILECTKSKSTKEVNGEIDIEMDLPHQNNQMQVIDFDRDINCKSKL